MGRRKWCFGRRDVICQTADCTYMRACIQRVYNDRVAEVHDLGLLKPKVKIPKIIKALKRARKTDGDKL